MKSRILKTSAFALCILIAVASFSQNVTIDYKAWNPASPPCNVFAKATNVPATIGGSSGTIEHQTKIGQPTYSTSDTSVLLECKYVSTSSSLGTKYRIAYNFKVGYRYIITVTSAELINTAGFPTGPYLRLDLTNSGGGGDTTCVGPQTVNPNLSGNPPAVQYSSIAFQDVQFLFSSLAAAFPTLEVSSIPAQTDGSSNSIRIRKITITEIAPPPSFSLSPSSVNKVCGTALNQTFTVNGSNIPQGATVSYLWNFGSATNGWLLSNGTPAPQTVTTTTNTLTLSAAACGTKPGNITVTANVNGTNYNAGTISVNLAPFSISGPSLICGANTTYSIANLNCNNATITWSVSPGGIVNPSCTTCSQTTLTKVSNGTITLSASISAACGTTPPPLSQNITVGAPTVSISGSPTGFCSGTYQTWSLSANPSSGGSNWYWYVSYLSAGSDIYIANPNSSSTFADVSGGGTISLSYTDLCGTTKKDGVTVYSNCYSFAMAPNPATSTVTVSAARPVKASKAIAHSTISEVNIYDQQGTLKKHQVFGKVKAANLAVTDLPAGVYVIEIIDGAYKERQLLKILK